MAKLLFVNATQARKDSRNNSDPWKQEQLKVLILGNIDAGVLYANVTTGTTMTGSNVYYKVIMV